MGSTVRTRELVAEEGSGESYQHVSFALYDRHLKRLLRQDEVLELGITLNADGRLIRYSPSFHWKIGQPGPTPVLLSQDVGARYGLCVKCAGG